MSTPQSSPQGQSPLPHSSIPGIVSSAHRLTNTNSESSAPRIDTTEAHILLSTYHILPQEQSRLELEIQSILNSSAHLKSQLAELQQQVNSQKQLLATQEHLYNCATSKQVRHVQKFKDIKQYIKNQVRILNLMDGVQLNLSANWMTMEISAVQRLCNDGVGITKGQDTILRELVEIKVGEDSFYGGDHESMLVKQGLQKHLGKTSTERMTERLELQKAAAAITAFQQSTHCSSTSQGKILGKRGRFNPMASPLSKENLTNTSGWTESSELPEQSSVIITRPVFDRILRTTKQPMEPSYSVEWKRVNKLKKVSDSKPGYKSQRKYIIRKIRGVKLIFGDFGGRFKRKSKEFPDF
ncbi:hypothetical protein RUND412_000018 [Rhizina undulata]